MSGAVELTFRMLSADENEPDGAERLRGTRKLAIAAAVSIPVVAAFVVVMAVHLLIYWYAKSNADEVPLASDLLPACPEHSPGVALNGLEPGPSYSGPALSISSLDERRTVSCNLSGVVVRFPDGHMMVVPSIGGIDGEVDGSGPNYSILNDGTYGVAAYRVGCHNKHTVWWGNPRAVYEWKLDLGEQVSPNCE